MVHPELSCFLITPICPHSLSFRPIIVPAYVELVVSWCQLSPSLFQVRVTGKSAWVSMDGRNQHELSQLESVRITQSRYPVPSAAPRSQ